MSRRLRVVTVALLLAGLVVVSPAPPVADAESGVVYQTLDYFVTPDQSSDVYPSAIIVAGMSGTIEKVTVTLNDLSHAFPSDLDILLVAPTGAGYMLMSDVGGGNPITNVDLVFDDAAGAGLPTASTIVSGTYRITNNTPGDVLQSPAPGGTPAANLAVMNGQFPNGEWRLYVDDDLPNADGGSIGSWQLSIDTTAAVPTVQGAGFTIPGSGAASAYPSQLTVSGLAGLVTDVQVRLVGLTHSYPDDLDVLLVDPSGRASYLMSDAGGSADISNVNLTFTQTAAFNPPSASLISTGVYRVANYAVSNDPFPAPAPAAPRPAHLDTFNGTAPNGVWKLFVVDDSPGDAGSLSGWELTLHAARVFSNTTPIQSVVQPNPAPAAEYPSALDLSARAGTVLTVSVQLFGVFHTQTQNLDILLVGPGGESVILMSDAGSGVLENGYLLFSSTATAPVPSPITTGTWAPTNVGTGDTFPLPAPTSGYGNSLDVFAGADVAGVWSLYVVDDNVTADHGVISGWQLSIALNVTPAIQPIPDQIMDEDSTLVVPVTVVDADNVSYTGFQLPNAGDLDPQVTLSVVPLTGTTANLIVTASGGSAGAYQVDLVVQDNLSTSPVESFALTVLASGDTDPPETLLSAPPPVSNGWHRSAVPVTISASDTGSGVRQITYAATGAHPVAATEITGASASLTVAQDGTTVVTAFASDNEGNIETPPQSIEIKLDRVAPSVTAPVASLPVGSQQANTTSVPVILNWTASDAASGIDRYQIQRSINGAAFQAVVLVTSPTATFSLTPGTAYQFRIRAFDVAGNAVNGPAGPSITPSLVQDSDPAITYTASTAWVQTAGGYALGGTIQLSGVTNATASHAFDGTRIAWVTTMAPSRGIIEVFIDGVSQGTVDLYRASLQGKTIVYQSPVLAAGTHTFSIRVTGQRNGSATSAAADIDALIVFE